ncbi:MAG: DUF3014 domain-containing protein [Pseudohongiellaceae bacterium]
MSKMGLYAVAAVAVSTMLYLVYMAMTFEPPQGTTTVIIAPPVQTEPEPQVEVSRPNPERSVLPQSIFRPEPDTPPVAVAEPVIAEMPEEIQVDLEPEPEITETTVRLPSLNRSDRFVFESIAELQNGLELISYLAEDQIVRKFVVFVENISRGEFPQSGLPYKAIQSPMPVRNIDENLYVMDETAPARFNQILNGFLAVDTEAALGLYRMLSPLFQQAYAEIGFRNESFDDTLRAAINNVLRTSDVEGPFQLVKPSVMYLFADSSIENMQAVNKQLIRLGPENTEKLKSKLREFSSLL